MEPNSAARKKPGPSGDATRDRLVEAAIDLFGRKGFDGVGAREIAAAARAPLSAIPYHYGTKDTLYRAALQQVIERLGEALAPAVHIAGSALAGPPAQATQALVLFQGALLDALVVNPEAESWAKLLLREHLDPSAAFDLVYQDAAKGAVDLIARLIAHATGRDPDDPAVLIEAFARMGEIMMFRLTRHAVLKRMGWDTLGPTEAQAIRKALRSA